MPKFQQFAESRNQDKYYVRGTFTHYNLDFADDVLHLADLGFKQISVEPVVAEDSEEYALREEDLPKLFAEYDKLAAEMVERKKSGKDFNFFHFMIGVCCTSAAAVESCKTVSAFFFCINITAFEFIPDIRTFYAIPYISHQELFISMEILMMHMILAVNCRKSGLSVQS